MHHHRLVAHGEGAGDGILDLGLGAVLAGLLRRNGQAMTFERTQRLEAAPPPPFPRLRLVHS